MTALHDTGELTCPRCSVTFEDVTLDAPTGSYDEQVRSEFDCPDCDAPLVLVIESAECDGLFSHHRE
jgi:transcription initiation factor IIE alpha subunit